IIQCHRSPVSIRARNLLPASLLERGDLNPRYPLFSALSAIAAHLDSPEKNRLSRKRLCKFSGARECRINPVAFGDWFSVANSAVCLCKVGGQSVSRSLSVTKSGCPSTLTARGSVEIRAADGGAGELQYPIVVQIDNPEIALRVQSYAAWPRNRVIGQI